MLSRISLTKFTKVFWYLYNRNILLATYLSRLIWHLYPKTTVITQFGVSKHILFFLALGSKYHETALGYLTDLELRHDCTNPDLIRRYYLGFAATALNAKKSGLVINLFENKVKNSPHSFWAWRILLDSLYLRGKNELFAKYYSQYLEIQNDIKNSCRIPTDVDYYGEYVTNSIGHVTYLADIAIAKKRGLIHSTSKDIIIKYPKASPYSLFFKNILTYYKYCELRNIPLARKSDIDFVEKRFLYQVNSKTSAHDYFQLRLRIYSEPSSAPNFKLSTETIIQGKNKLKRLGISDSDWYVVLHVRRALDGSLRNADIRTYLDSIREVNQRGGHIIRIGDRYMPRLPTTEKCLDLAYSESPDSDLDLFLLATCKFAIVSNSGPAEIPFYYNTCRVITNVLCIKHVVTLPGDILVPTLFYDKSRHQYVSMSNVLNSSTFSSETNIREAKNIEFRQNTSDEILSAVCEMFNSFEQKRHPQTTDQAKFHSMCRASNFPFHGRISELWLHKYSSLI